MIRDHESAKGKPSLDKFKLTDKVALVTGASRGIGRAIAIGLAEAGCDVVLASRKLPDLEAVAREISALGRRALPVSVNLRRVEEIGTLIDRAVAGFGRIDILVNNAAANPVYGSILDMDERGWEATTTLNLRGYFFVSQAAARLMKEQGGGKIINVASLSGIRPDVGLGVYSICKAGVLMMTQAFAQELGPFNIRVNSITPGTVKTSFSESVWSNPELLRKTEEYISIRHVADPEEIAGAAVFLASEASSYMTGQTVVLDGGRFPPAPSAMLSKLKAKE